MNQRPNMTLAASLLLTAFALGCSQPKQAQIDRSDANAPVAEIETPAADPIADRLDSLAAISDGDYIHIYIGPCYGRCDGYVSLWRESPAKYYIYEAEGWKYNEEQRDFILHRVRRPVGSDEAKAIIQSARDAGILRLVNDMTRAITDQSHFWLRASIGGETVEIDNAYAGGEKYAGRGEGEHLSTIYQNVRTALFSYLFSR